MNRINQSQYLLTNNPMDSIKSGVYNGLELRWCTNRQQSIFRHCWF